MARAQFVQWTRRYARETGVKASKRARHITVDEVAYRWRASGNDGYISVVIWPADPGRHPSGALICRFDYHQVCVPAGPEHCRLHHQIVITNRIIRRVILHAIATHRYEPARRSGPLELGALDRFVDISDAIRS